LYEDIKTLIKILSHHNGNKFEDIPDADEEEEEKA